MTPIRIRSPRSLEMSWSTGLTAGAGLWVRYPRRWSSSIRSSSLASATALPANSSSRSGIGSLRHEVSNGPCHHAFLFGRGGRPTFEEHQAHLLPRRGLGASLDDLVGELARQLEAVRRHDRSP